jgi:hypothetical protein
VWQDRGVSAPLEHRTAPPPPVSFPPPVRIDPVPGTPFAVAILGTRPIVTGLASGSLATGIGSLLVSFVVGFFALVGASAGWGPIAAGAFAVLSGVVGLGAIVLGILALRQVRRSSALRGRGLALTGIILGALGVAFTLVAVLAAFALAG